MVKRTSVVTMNDKKNIVEFERHHIYISTNADPMNPNRAIELSIYPYYSNKSTYEDLYRLLDKVVDDVEKCMIGTGGTREVKIANMSQSYRMNIDIYGEIVPDTACKSISINFILETLEKGKLNDVCTVYMSPANAHDLLEIWEV